MNWPAIFLSLRLALTTTAVLFVLALPLAWWIAFSRRRWMFLVEAVVALPLVLPPTVLGFYVLAGLGARSPLGRAYAGLFGSPLPFTFAGLVVASVLYSLPFGVQPLVASFRLVDKRYLQASEMLGSSRLRTFLTVTLPLSRAGLITSLVLAFAHTLGEFGVVLMVGGNIPGVTQTVSIAIYDEAQTLNYAAAGRTSLALLVFSFAVLAAVYGAARASWSLWRPQAGR
ncbi:MAG TPA: molybdate ABC transporter permease subunit [Terriglobales bacterium]|nr:molybdate ABC transporter permease subunit [Terriglobales bacterium]